MKKSNYDAPSWNDSELEEYIASFLENYPCPAVSEIIYTPNLEKFVQAVGRHVPSSRQLNDFQLTLWWNLKRESRAIATCLHEDDLLGLEIPTAICVYPLAGDFSEAELLSIIRDHEYTHALDWFSGIPINSHHKITNKEKNKDFFSPDTIRLMMEVRACKKQLEAMPEDWKDSNLHRMILGYGKGCRDSLGMVVMSPKCGFEQEAVCEFLSSNSEF